IRKKSIKLCGPFNHLISGAYISVMNSKCRTSGMNPGRSALGFHYTDVSTGYQMIEGSTQFDRFFPDMRIEDGGARYFVVKDSQISQEEYLNVCELLKQKYTDVWKNNKDWQHLGRPESFYKIL